jgi:cell division septation protein DedD
VAPGSGYAEPSFFSLQIAAYADAARAGQTAADWRRRGVEAFLLEPEESGNGLFRVCVGKFDDLADANREAARLEEAEGIRPFITLVAAAKARAS